MLRQSPSNVHMRTVVSLEHETNVASDSVAWRGSRRQVEKGSAAWPPWSALLQRWPAPAPPPVNHTAQALFPSCPACQATHESTDDVLMAMKDLRVAAAEGRRPAPDGAVACTRHNRLAVGPHGRAGDTAGWGAGGNRQRRGAARRCCAGPKARHPASAGRQQKPCSPPDGSLVPAQRRRAVAVQCPEPRGAGREAWRRESGVRLRGRQTRAATRVRDYLSHDVVSRASPLGMTCTPHTALSWPVWCGAAAALG